MPLKYALSQRGGSKLIHDGFSFAKDALNSDRTVQFWRCDQKDALKCKTRVHTANDKIVGGNGHAHNHEAAAARIRVIKHRGAMLAEAATTQHTTTALIDNFNAHVGRHCTGFKPNKSALRRAIIKKRAKTAAAPALPQSVAELIVPDPYTMINRADEDPELFLKFDSADSEDEQYTSWPERMLIFTTVYFMNILQDMGGEKHLYADGTFKIAPAIFFQLYTVHVRRFGITFPVFYVLLTRKTEDIYERMWSEIIKL